MVALCAADTECLSLFAQQGSTADSQTSIACLGTLIEANEFAMATKATDAVAAADVKEAISAVREANQRVTALYGSLFSKIEEQKNIPVKTVPPFTWYQDLYRIYIEVKHANRFDVAGCGTLFNETINISESKFHVSASCEESQETKIFYELKFPLWGKIKEDYKFQRKPVGKFLFTLDKQGAPTRWKQLYKEGTKRPQTMKLDLDKHQQHHYSLSDFEDDEIEDFEGWDIFDYEEDQDPDDMGWLFPKTGPGEFRHLKDKKKKKSKKNKKGKKKAKKD